MYCGLKLFKHLIFSKKADQIQLISELYETSCLKYTHIFQTYEKDILKNKISPFVYLKLKLKIVT